MDIQRIVEARSRALAECWTFDRMMTVLHGLGVARIRMNLATGETEYAGEEGDTIILSPLGPGARPCADGLDLQALEAARDRYLLRETDRETFYDQLAAAGVWFFELDTFTREARHYDRHNLPRQGLYITG